MRKIICFVLAVFIFLGCKQQLESRLASETTGIDVKEADYFGQVPPENSAKLFAPEVISNGLTNRDITISPDGNEIYFTSATSNYSFATIFVVSRKNGGWSLPEVVSFGEDPSYINIEPCLSSDGQKIFFASNRPINDSAKIDDMNIWVSKKINNVWSLPKPLDTAVNSRLSEYYPSVTTDGTLYFTREMPNRENYIFQAKLIKNKYLASSKLPEQVNCGTNRFNAYISPNERFIIVPAMGVEKNVAGVRYYISFKENELWSEPKNMGPSINDNLSRGWSASLSPDGKYLFFMASKNLEDSQIPASLSYDFFNLLQSMPENGNSDIYWIKSEFINGLK